MKIAEIIMEYFGDVDGETMIMHPSPQHKRNKRDQIPQVGYGIEVGDKVIATPHANSDNDLGQSNQVIGG